MLLRTLCFTLLYLVSSSLTGQDEPAVHAELNALPKASSQRFEKVWTTLGPTDDYAYFVGYSQGKGKHNKGANVSIYALGKDGKPARRIDVPPPHREKSVTYESVSLRGDYINVYSSFVNKKTDECHLLVQRIHAKTLAISEEPRVLLTLDGADKRDGSYFEVTGANQADLADVVEFRVDKPGKEFDVHLTVFDQDLHPVRTHVVPNLDKEAYARFYGVRATGDGTIYYVLSEGGDARRYASDPGQRYLYRIAPDGSSIRRRMPSGSNTTPTAPYVSVRTDGSLLATGRFLEANTGEYAGLYFSTYDGETLEELSTSTSHLALDAGGLLTNRSGGRSLDKDAKDLIGHYRLNDILYTQDGGAYVVGECYYRTEFVSRETGNVYYFHTYRGLLVTRLDQAGSVSFFRHIPVGVKVNLQPGAKVLDDKLLLTFYAERKNRHNLTDYVDKVEDNFKKQILWHVWLDEQGNISSGGNPQFTKSDLRESVDPRHAVLSPSGTAIYYYGFERGGRRVLEVSLSKK